MAAGRTGADSRATKGHRRGKDSVRAVVDAARELGIPYLTLYRVLERELGAARATEVSFLMSLFHRYLITETKRLMKRDIRVVALGDTERLPPRVREALAETVAATRENRTMTVALALSYGGRQDIVNAARSIARAVAEGALSPEQIDEQLVARELTTTGLPDPDLLIRTSGELRVSNFFLFQLAYTELYFTDTLWPDFREREFLSAIAAYQLRERRFGAVTTAPTPVCVLRTRLWTAAVAAARGGGAGAVRAAVASRRLSRVAAAVGTLRSRRDDRRAALGRDRCRCRRRRRCRASCVAWAPERRMGGAGDRDPHDAGAGGASRSRQAAAKDSADRDWSSSARHTSDFCFPSSRCSAIVPTASTRCCW